MLIHMRKIKKHFEMGTQTIRAVDGVDLDVEQNEYMALMGPSGSGKTTFMTIIGCLDTPTSGVYELNERDVTELPDNVLAHIRNKEIGFVFQTFNLLPKASAFQNVELPLIYGGFNGKERQERVWEALHAVSLEDRAHHRPNELSGGQRQRVAVARALVNKPSIILADEPTGNLDSKSGTEIMEVFDSLNRDGNTIIVVTHEDHIARFCNRVVRIRDGLIESDDRVR
ncbi:MAG: ABC transporter ATP-binding protein [Candidatus Latescibacterota bacterium]|nr:MAG: ABC transporter ATP-binding protein [Candidatus Latescibacterota bacterium]